jgi:hypothetical protein
MPRPGGGECSTRLTFWVGVDGSRCQRRRKQPSLRYGLVIQLVMLEAVAKTFPVGIRAAKWGSLSSSRVIGLNCRSSTRWSTIPACWSITTSRPLFRSPIKRQTDDVFRSCTPQTTSSSAKTLRGRWNAKPQRIFRNWPIDVCCSSYPRRGAGFSIVRDLVVRIIGVVIAAVGRSLRRHRGVSCARRAADRNRASTARGHRERRAHGSDGEFGRVPRSCWLNIDAIVITSLQ